MDDTIKGINICGLSDTGPTRELNEDAFLIGSIIERTGQIDLYIDMNSLAMQEQGLLVCVADGMGGLTGGAFASTNTLNVISRQYYSRFYKNITPEEVIDAIKKYIMKANSVLIDATSQKPELQAMGTTLVGLNILNNKFYRFHVGDSRLYQFRDGYLNQITTDHSLAQQLVDSGHLHHEDVANYSRKNEITNAIGIDNDCKPEIDLVDVKKGDILLLCSDGLSNVLDHYELPKELSELSILIRELMNNKSELCTIANALSNEEIQKVYPESIEKLDSCGGHQQKKSGILNFLSKNNKVDECGDNRTDSMKYLTEFREDFQKFHKNLSMFIESKKQNLIETVLKKPITMKEKLQTLIDMGIKRRADDNMTAILIEVR